MGMEEDTEEGTEEDMEEGTEEGTDMGAMGLMAFGAACTTGMRTGAEWAMA